MQQQTRGHLAVGRVLFDQRAGRQDCGLVDFLDRDPVVEVLECFLEDCNAVDEFAQALACRLDRRLKLREVQGFADPAFGDVQRRCLGRRLIDVGARAFL